MQVFLLLVIARRPAKQAMPVAYLVTSVIALIIWRVPFLVLAAEILYIIFSLEYFWGNSALKYLTRVRSDRQYSSRIISYFPERRIQAVVIV